MITVLLTGATGALGRAVTAYLNDDTRYRLVTAGRDDLGNPAAIMERAKPDIVMHLAATFADDWDEAYAINVETARLLLDAAAGRRVLLAGSAAEYGVVRPEENPIREGRPLAPVSTYGKTKALQTALAGQYKNVVVARIFNLDGPGMSERLFVGRVQKQIAEIKAGRRVTLEIGPLSAIRDYLPVAEAAQRLHAIAEKGESGGVYHVASGVPIRMRDLLVRILKENGLEMSCVREAAHLSNRSGYDVPEIYADIRRTLAL